LGNLNCFGEWLTPVGFQPEPALFRTTFVWPGDLGTEARLRFATRFDDGVVFFLNGQEILRTNLPAGAITASTRALSATAGVCRTNLLISVGNLRAGTNSLTAAIASALGVNDFVFGLELWATTLLPGPLPENPPPVLHLESVGPGSVRLSWEGAGYALESSTELSSNLGSAPDGPWEQVPNMANPYLYVDPTPLEGAPHLFRLKR
jgi:hypothetical protein